MFATDASNSSLNLQDCLDLEEQGNLNTTPEKFTHEYMRNQECVKFFIKMTEDSIDLDHQIHMKFHKVFGYKIDVEPFDSLEENIQNQIKYIIYIFPDKDNSVLLRWNELIRFPSIYLKEKNNNKTFSHPLPVAPILSTKINTIEKKEISFLEELERDEVRENIENDYNKKLEQWENNNSVIVNNLGVGDFVLINNNAKYIRLETKKSAIGKIIKDCGASVIIATEEGVLAEYLLKKELAETAIEVKVDLEKKIDHLEDIFIIKSSVLNKLNCQCRKKCGKGCHVESQKKIVIIRAILIGVIARTLNKY